MVILRPKLNETGPILICDHPSHERYTVSNVESQVFTPNTPMPCPGLLRSSVARTTHNSGGCANNYTTAPLKYSVICVCVRACVCACVHACVRVCDMYYVPGVSCCDNVLVV